MKSFGFFLATIGIVGFFALVPIRPVHALNACVSKENNCETQDPNSKNCCQPSDPRARVVDPAQHVCHWEGLSLKCFDTEVEVCTTEAQVQCQTATAIPPVSGLFQIADVVTQFVRLTQWGLGMVVALAVLMFVWAGFQFVTAAGRGEKVEAGKKIIGGTITGLLISFSAYVIINFAVMALTGTWNKSIIGTVFPGLTESQPFSGTVKTGVSPSSCRSGDNDTYDKGCSDHIYCADPAGTNLGDVKKIQKQLTDLGCATSVDGCFGPNTMAAVRRFQVANYLPPTGEVDAGTAATLFMPGPAVPVKCTGTIDAITSHLPSILDYQKVIGLTEAQFSEDGTGCCIVGDGQNDVYCAPNVSTQTCHALNGGGGNTFLMDKSCNGADTNNRCGFCKSTDPYSQGTDNYCFDYATPYWCTNVATDTHGGPLAFQPSTCTYYCPQSNASMCIHSLMSSLKYPR